MKSVTNSLLKVQLILNKNFITSCDKYEYLKYFVNNCLIIQIHCLIINK